MLPIPKGPQRGSREGLVAWSRPTRPFLPRSRGDIVNINITATQVASTTAVTLWERYILDGLQEHGLAASRYTPFLPTGQRHSSASWENGAEPLGGPSFNLPGHCFLERLVFRNGPPTLASFGGGAQTAPLTAPYSTLTAGCSPLHSPEHWCCCCLEASGLLLLTSGASFSSRRGLRSVPCVAHPTPVLRSRGLPAAFVASAWHSFHTLLLASSINQ